MYIHSSTSCVLIDLYVPKIGFHLIVSKEFRREEHALSIIVD